MASLPRICRLEITLRGIEPPIWRSIEVRDDITLGRLHRILQDVMGWEMLDTLYDPRDPEFHHTRSWIAGWESEAFDLEAINRRLRRPR